METEKLYKLVEELDIKLDFFPLPLNKSMAVNLDNRYYIALDPTAVISGMLGSKIVKSDN